jgi:hypothetical protein
MISLETTQRFAVAMAAVLLMMTGLTNHAAAEELVPRAKDRYAPVEYRDMLVTVRNKIAALKTRGMSVEEVLAAKPTARYDAKSGKPSSRRLSLWASSMQASDKTYESNHDTASAPGGLDRSRDSHLEPGRDRFT